MNTRCAYVTETMTNLLDFFLFIRAFVDVKILWVYKQKV